MNPSELFEVLAHSSPELAELWRHRDIDRGDELWQFVNCLCDAWLNDHEEAFFSFLRSAEELCRNLEPSYAGELLRRDLPKLLQQESERRNIALRYELGSCLEVEWSKSLVEDAIEYFGFLDVINDNRFDSLPLSHSWEPEQQQFVRFAGAADENGTTEVVWFGKRDGNDCPTWTCSYVRCFAADRLTSYAACGRLSAWSDEAADSHAEIMELGCSRSRHLWMYGRVDAAISSVVMRDGTLDISPVTTVSEGTGAYALVSTVPWSEERPSVQLLKSGDVRLVLIDDKGHEIGSISAVDGYGVSLLP